MYEMQGKKDLAEIKVENLSRPRIFMSHFPYEQLPCGPANTTPCKYIHVVRNPKDVASSLFCFTKCYSDSESLEWNTFWKTYMVGDVPYSDYFDNLLSWWPHINDQNVLFLMYEDMKESAFRDIKNCLLYED